MHGSIVLFVDPVSVVLFILLLVFLLFGPRHIPEVARVYARCPGCSSPDFDLVAGRGIWLLSVTGVD